MPRAPLLLLLLPLLPTPVPAAAALLPRPAAPRPATPLVPPPEGRRLRRALRALLRLDDATLQSLAEGAPPPPPPPLQSDPQDRLDRLSGLLAAPAWPAGRPGPLQTPPGPVAPAAAAPVPSRRRRAPNPRRYHARRYLYFLSAGECPQAPDGRPRMYCPTRGDEAQWVCVDEEELCDGVDHCPGGEDEEPTHCLFHTAMRGHMEILTKYVMLSKLT
ncbi:actin-binding protein WASF1-like [Eriocheir sinensis]|uniref:actin-binding protein WASF1-like n=1 Tax=Eriocheir sinensis TaxID=95602 RepID=UPI0021C80781|nr:actin-binding protein WASF1-like [Eriocheir sinensis]